MKAKQLAVLVAGVLVLGVAGAPAATIFSDSFDATDGTDLKGRLPTIGGGAWTTVDNQTVLIYGGAVDTSYEKPGGVGAFATFTQALGAGQTLTLTFSTLLPKNNFFTPWGSGYAGVSLFAGNNEPVFLGKPGWATGWGCDGWMGGATFGPSINSAAQNVVFTYDYDTGAWSYAVGSQGMSGTMQAGIAFDQLRIGASDNQSYNSDINVSDIQVTTSGPGAVPEPATGALGLLGGVLCLGRRACRRFRPTRAS